MNLEGKYIAILVEENYQELLWYHLSVKGDQVRWVRKQGKS
jgi:hypothetical protein